MRARVLAFCVLVLFVIGLLIWLHPKSGSSRPLLSQAEATRTNLQPVSAPSSGQFSNSAAPKPPGAMVTETLNHSIPQSSNAIQQRILAAWQAPIDFYGKVVDENTNPVSGAEVAFDWMETPSNDGEKTASTQSDTDGLFSLQGKRGASLTVSVEKNGYNTSGGRQTFHYAVLGNFSSSIYAPVVFQLVKKGIAVQLIHIKGIGLHPMRDYLLATDGKPTDISLSTGHLTPQGEGDLQVAFTAGPSLENNPTRITWQCVITVPGGGLLQTSQEFPFLAPEGGYSVSDELNISATNWAEEVDRQYYVKLGNGNFGRVNLRIIGVARPYFRLESFLNPSGSPNLEVDPQNVVQPE
jgi:hypothetical protein